MNKIAEGSANEFVADELVVAIPHRDLVLQRLTGTKVTVGPESTELGLSLVKFADIAHAAEQVRREREDLGIPPPPLPDGLPERLHLEHLMADLRVIFAHEYGRWTPTMGKNRVMRGIQLFPYPNFGGDGFPTPVNNKNEPETITTDPAAGDRVRVMVLDTQVAQHRYLTGRYIAGSDSLLEDTAAARRWWAGHATFVSGLIIQRAPAVQLEIESVLKVNGGSPSAWDVALTMIRCARRGVDVLNLSFGCFTLDGEPPLVLERAIRRLTPTMVVVAAAGNYGAVEPVDDMPPTPKTPIWPAAFEDVVAVGANKRKGEPAPFSPRVPWIDFMAPGFKVESTYLKGEVQVGEAGEAGSHREIFKGMAAWSGTSFAAAAVSGAIAARTEPGRRTAQQALEKLRTGAYGASGAGIEPAHLLGR
jgi:hypothetical protein